MIGQHVRRAISLFLSLAAGGCLGMDETSHTDAEQEEFSAEQEELNDKRQDFVATENGLQSINGLTTSNGLQSINGLTTSNGLQTRNGLTTINGLTTRNGLRSQNGFRVVNGIKSSAVLNVDCRGGQTLNNGGANAGTCTGEPDGMLSRKTGLMSTDDGIIVAKYMIRCAAPTGRSLTVRDYTGGLITLNGELGLAPEWLDGATGPGECAQDCQEKVSACLMALTSATGVKHTLVLTSPSLQIGTGKDPAFPYQEATFYGNLFAEPPQAFVAAGPDFGVFAMRRCDSGDRTRRTTYVMAGAVGPCAMRRTAETISERRHSTDVNKCSVTNVAGNRGVATACAGPGSTTRSWKNPITTYRQRYDFPEQYWGKTTTCQ